MPSKIYKQGKFTVVEFPEEWQQMVLKFYNEHPDLVLQAQQAGVRIDDGSFYPWLNMILGCNVTSGMAMDVGCKIISEALDKRRQTQGVEAAGRKAIKLLDHHGKVIETEVDLLKGAGTVAKENLFYDPKNPDDVGARADFQTDFAKTHSKRKS